MAGTATSASGARQSSRPTPEPTGWVGWIIFAGTLMILAGSFHIIQGLMAILRDEYYLVAKSGLTVELDYTSWGWTHIIAGVVVAGAGLALASGQMWGRVVGVILAAVSALLNFAFIAAYPFWSAIVIAIDLFIIYALTVHGREMTNR